MEWFGNIPVLVCGQDCKASACHYDVSEKGVFLKARFQSRRKCAFSHCLFLQRS